MTPSLTDPLGSSPIAAAVLWLQGTLLGTVATTAAVVAVASVGVLMLTGRVNLRHGATVVLGCFILFGAASIAAGIRSAAMAVGEPDEPDEVAIAPSPPVQLPPSPPPGYDPYAGASVPPR
jgi:type IV secretory pathway VirB2 component (pilin)